MAHGDETMKYDLDPAGVPQDDFSLEDILAEYGGGREKKLMQDVEQEIHPLEAVKPRKAAPLPETPKEAKPEPPVLEEPPLPPEVPKPPRPITLEQVVGSTVDAVMEENREPLLQPRRGLFSRRKMEETEQLYDAPEPEPEPEPEPIGPEPEFYEVAIESRKKWQAGRSMLVPAALLALAPVVLAAAEEYGGVVIPYWTGDLRVQSIAMLVCLVLMGLLCRQVFVRAAQCLWRRRFSGDVLAALSALVCAADCGAYLLLPERTAVPGYGMAAMLVLAAAQWGAVGEERGLYDTFHTAAIDSEPPYLVTDTPQGACKQRGAAAGFYTTLRRDGFPVLLQTALLPVVFLASIVFAGLSSLGQDRGADFLLNWSAILTAGATLSLPLAWSLPWAKLTRLLQKTGSAVAGWCGAERISRRRTMIVTDADLFPPGTIQLNGIKLFGEEMRVVVAHAATLAREAGSGLGRVFDGLLRGEAGHYEPLDDFSFYAEGGWSGTIRGETVLMGTASFMRKMDVRVPTDISLKTGIFLAVDGELTAVFAVKYNASENVDYALRMMRRSHITPILASRDPNITPGLLQRKFHKGVKVQYPDITSRVALSEAERDHDLPRALLLREGLLPYAEAVAGSRRLCQAVRRALLLALAGSVAGVLLAFYLVSLSAYDLLRPLALVIFLLLWALPVLLMADWTGRY